MRIGDLDVDIPPSWEDHSLYSFVAPPADISPDRSLKPATFRKNVVLQRRPVGEETTLEDCVEQLKASTERDFGEVKVTVEEGPESPFFVSKRLSYKVVDSVTNQPVAQVIYLGLVGRTEWQIAFSAPALSLAESLPELDAIVASIRPAEAP